MRTEHFRFCPGSQGSWKLKTGSIVCSSPTLCSVKVPLKHILPFNHRLRCCPCPSPELHSSPCHSVAISHSLPSFARYPNFLFPGSLTTFHFPFSFFPFFQSVFLLNTTLVPSSVWLVPNFHSCCNSLSNNATSLPTRQSGHCALQFPSFRCYHNQTVELPFSLGSFLSA